MKYFKMYQHAHKNKGQLFTPKKILKHFDWLTFEENPNAQPLIM